MRHGNPNGSAGPVRTVEYETPSRLKLDAPILEDADAKLGSLHVGHDAYGPERIPFQLAHDPMAPGVVLGFAMTEIEAEDIDPCLEQCIDGRCT